MKLWHFFRKHILAGLFIAAASLVAISPHITWAESSSIDELSISTASNVESADIPLLLEDNAIVCTNFSEFCDAIDNGEQCILFTLTNDVIWSEALLSSETSDIIKLTISGNIGENEAISGEISDEYYAISTDSASDWFNVANSNINTLVTLENVLFQNLKGNNSILSFEGVTLYIDNSIFDQMSIPTVLQAGTISLETTTGYVSNSLFSNNTSASTGAAIYAQDLSTLKVTNSIFYKNSTTGDYTGYDNSGGGAICVYGSEATISYSQFISNSSAGRGGAILNAYNSGDSIGQSTKSRSTLYVYDSDFISNSASTTALVPFSIIH